MTGGPEGWPPRLGNAMAGWDLARQIVVAGASRDTTLVYTAAEAWQQCYLDERLAIVWGLVRGMQRAQIIPRPCGCPRQCSRQQFGLLLQDHTMARLNDVGRQALADPGLGLVVAARLFAAGGAMLAGEAVARQREGGGPPGEWLLSPGMDSVAVFKGGEPAWA